MSITQPLPQSTVIKAYKGVAWDKSLKDIRWFATVAERESYLASLLLATWNNCSIVSTGKSIRVEGEYNACVECNYLTWQNGNSQSGVPGRKFFAWITAVNYVNAQTVEFQYEVDWIQTYRFEFAFGSCMIEREHVTDDIQGKYVLDERIETGEYKIDRQEYMDFEPALVINYLRNEYMAQIVDNMYTPGKTYVAPISNTTKISTVNEILADYNNAPERITSLFMGVANMDTPTPGDQLSTLFHTQMTQLEETAFTDLSDTSTSDSYIPQNKKMLCYPYKFMTADNYNGSVVQYRWENFNTVGSATFIIEGCAMPKPAMQFFPIDYRSTKATSTARNTYEQESLTYDNFPFVNYATDAFKAWVSQYGTSFAVETGASIVGQVVGMAASIGIGNYAGAIAGVAGVAETATSAYAEYNEHKIHSKQNHGSVSTSGLSYARGEVGFRVTQYSITKEMAKRIDKYLTRYGYRVERIGTPNIYGRQYFNYVKCSEVEVAGNIAVDAKLQMEEALTKGTTFWHINNMTSEISSNPIVTT